MKRMRQIAVLLSVCFATSAARTLCADEQHATASFAVTASVLSNCRLTIPPLNFGDYDPLGVHAGANLDATTAILVSCTKDARATIVMDGGTYAAPNGAFRFLAAGGERLSYQIFRDSARTKVWGTGENAMAVISNGVRTPQEVAVYGRIGPGQQVPSGLYSDVVTATVDF